MMNFSEVEIVDSGTMTGMIKGGRGVGIIGVENGAGAGPASVSALAVSCSELELPPSLELPPPLEDPPPPPETEADNQLVQLVLLPELILLEPAESMALLVLLESWTSR